MNLQQLLRPDWDLSTTLAQMPLENLLAQGIRALVLDVDRTLLPRRQAEMPPLMEAWLRQAKDRLRLHLFSNNPSRRRIGSVARQLDLPFTTSAGKPRRSALRRVLADLELPPVQVALAGDRLFTDVVVGKVTLVVAHGNSLRGLVKHLEGISDEDIAELNIPTGIPLVYELSKDMKPKGPGRYLDPEAAQAGSAAVASQGKKKR